MEVHLKNMDEFVPWVLQFGSDAIVLEPKSLRVRKELLSAYENY